MRCFVRGVLVAVSAQLLGCGDGMPGAPPAPASVHEALGEPVSGFPSPEERLMVMAVNRARSDPSVVKGPQSTIYPARPPLLWHYDLSRSSRFHAQNMNSADVTLMHTSPCTLNANVATSGCDGTVSCACASAVGSACAACANVSAINTCGTDTWTRIGYFTNIARAEVAAAGYSDTFSAVSGWVDEAAGADGHRKILLDQGTTSTVMGAGHVTTGTSCWSSYDVSDTGYQSGLAIPKVPTAAVSPVRGTSSTTFTFYATWADPAQGAPRSLDVVIDGTCHPLARELGSPTLNSTWKYSSTLATGCHTYLIAGEDDAGVAVAYPTTGALLVGAGTSCADYPATAPSYSCGPCTGCMSGATCVPGDTAAACGINGQACVTCNDGLSCTSDRCAAGRCVSDVNVGFCVVSGACIPAGASCDDGDPCTAADQCVGSDAGCRGTPYSCDDLLECTADSCSGDGGCGHVLMPSACLIDGGCHTAGEMSGPCRQCSPSAATDQWSNVADGTPCPGGTCQAGSCELLADGGATSGGTRACGCGATGGIEAALGALLLVVCLRRRGAGSERRAG